MQMSSNRNTLSHNHTHVSYIRLTILPLYNRVVICNPHTFGSMLLMLIGETGDSYRRSDSPPLDPESSL